MSRKTVQRLIASGKLVDAGTDPDTGERLVTIESIVAERERRRVPPAESTPVEPHIEALADQLLPVTGIVVKALNVLGRELEANRAELAQVRQVAQIAEKSMSTLQAERDAAAAEAERLRHLLSDVTSGGPFSRWRKRRDVAARIAMDMGGQGAQSPDS